MADPIKVPLIKIGVPNRNGLIFTEESINEAINKGYHTLIGLNEIPKDTPRISEASHVGSNLRIEGDHLVADIIILDNERGNVLKNIISDVEFTAIGYGKVDQDGVVSDYTILGTSIISKG